jgi:hypothetical protein
MYLRGVSFREPGGNLGFSHLEHSDKFLRELRKAARVAHAFVIVSQKFETWKVWGFRTDCKYN